MFRGVSVLLDKSESESDALAHAREWAARLRLPLRGLERPAPGAPPLFLPFELFVLDKELPAAFKNLLLCRLLQTPQTSALLCPRGRRPVSRVLMLNGDARAVEGLANATAEVCRAFRVAPVLLTVARSEAEARVRERFAEEALARRGLTADCDIAAGCDVTTAAIRAARWRRCSHVIAAQHSVPWWRRWLGSDVVRELAALPDAPALVAVPLTPDS